MNSDGDIVIAGTHAFDRVEPAIDAVMAEWTSTRNFTATARSLQTANSTSLASQSF